MTNYEKEFPDMDPEVRLRNEIEDAIDARNTLNIKPKFFANRLELILMIMTIMGLLYMVNLSLSYSQYSELGLSICLGLEWIYFGILSIYYIKFF